MDRHSQRHDINNKEIDMAQPFRYVSAITTSLLMPIIALVERLESKPAAPPNDVQTSSYENGYACAIVVLAVIALESAANRVCFLRGDNPKTLPLAEYLASIIGAARLDPIEAVVSARDAIVHNHLWTAEVLPGKDGDLEFASEPTLKKDEYGDAKFRRVMDPSTRQTKPMEINLFPPRIWRADAYKVLRVVVGVLRLLQNIDVRYINLDLQLFEYRGQVIAIEEIIRGLRA